MAVLALSRLPFVTVGDITQRLDTRAMTVENKVCVGGSTVDTRAMTVENKVWGGRSAGPRLDITTL